MSLLVFTMDYTRPPMDRSLLDLSASNVGIKIESYGTGKPWPRHFGQAGVIDALEYLKGRSENLVLYTDSPDSFILGNEYQILDAWNRAGAPDILLQAEKNPYPDRDWTVFYPPCDTPWRYICSGGWMGRRGALIQMLEEIKNGELYRTNSYCVQRDFIDWWLHFPGARERAKLDYKCEVFQTMYMTEEMEEDGRNGITGTYPIVWHFNGKTPGMREWYARLIQK